MCRLRSRNRRRHQGAGTRGGEQGAGTEEGIKEQEQKVDTKEREHKRGTTEQEQEQDTSEVDKDDDFGRYFLLLKFCQDKELPHTIQLYIITFKRHLYFEMGWKIQGFTQNIKIAEKVIFCLQMVI